MMIRRMPYWIAFSLCLSAFAISAAAEELLVDRVIAVINDDVITQSEFDAVFRPVHEELFKNYGGNNFESDLNGIRLKLLNQMVEDRLVYQESQRLDIQVADEEIQTEIGHFKEQFHSEAEFEKMLGVQGMTIGLLENRFRERLAIEKLHQLIIRGRVVVPPDDVEDFYHKHPEEFQGSEELETWVITVLKHPQSVERGTMDEAAKRKASSLIDLLGKGEDFQGLAQTHSDDTYATEGGYLGLIRRGTMVADIDQVLFGMEEGSVSDVLETDEAYHIFKVGGRVTTKTLSFEEARDKIYQMLFRQKAHARFMEWMEALKEKSYISIR